MSSKLNVAILGSGNIGTDLLIKVLRSSYLRCVLFAGRNLQSAGMRKAQELGVKVSADSIHAVLECANSYDLVFDATSAEDHLTHWRLLKPLGKMVIDFTPSHIGKQIIPTINVNEVRHYRNVNMVSCGGQASIPLAYAVSQVSSAIRYIEVVSSIASNSAGPATRINIDEYIANTEEGLRAFTGCKNVKAILILNPAQPSVDMQTTVSLKIDNPNMNSIKISVARLEQQIQRYVPGYKVIVPPVYEDNRVMISVRVKGLGDYLPDYSGNLDIINCAGIVTAEEYARQFCKSKEEICQVSC